MNVLLLLFRTHAIMDVYVLLDAIAKCMSSEESELNKVRTSYIYVQCTCIMWL